MIYVPILDRPGYSFLFRIRKVKLYQDSLLIDNEIICGNLYILKLSDLPYVFVFIFIDTVSSTKRLRLDEKSSILWHKRLAHISRQRRERLIKDEILPDLDLSYFDTCVDCIKGKLIAKLRNAKADRCIELLEIIHIDICESFTPPAIGGHKYFITFIVDNSHYGFFELIREKFLLFRCFQS